MINCPKCGAGNQVGTLFCRSCGDRLNLDEIRPQTMDEVRRSQGIDVWKWLRIARKIAVFALIAFCLYVIIGFFRQPAVTPVSALSGAEKAAAQKKMDALFRVGLKPAVQSFSSAELSTLADEMLGLPVKTENPGLALVPEHMEVEVLPSGLMRATLRCRLMGTAVFNTAIFRVETGDAGPSVRLVTAMFGAIHLPGFAQSVVTGRLESVLAASPEAKYLKGHASAAAVDMDAGKLSLTLPAGISDKAMRDELEQALAARAARNAAPAK